MLNRFPTLCLAVSLSAAAIMSCGDDGPARPAPSLFAPLIEQFDLTPLPETPYPGYNPFFSDRISLGRLLFFDPILGGESAPWVKVAAGKDPYRFRENDVACGSCHHPDFGFADGSRLGAGVGGNQTRPDAVGPERRAPGTSIVTGNSVGLEPRNSPTVLNTGLNGRGTPAPESLSFQFLDGRVTLGLEEQAQEPIADREEMAGDAYGRDVAGDDLTTVAIQDSVTARIRHIPGYVALFQKAFPGEILSAEDIELSHITQTLAAYERELRTPGSRYDAFVSGDFGVFSAREQEGFLLFFGQALCGTCHRGPMLSDFDFHVQGAADDYAAVLPGFPGKNGIGGDFGRFHADPEEFADQKYAFRTLTIRNVELTAPYFHSGSAATLEDVVRFYNRGGRGSSDLSDAVLAEVGARREDSIRPLGLSNHEIQALVEFMRTTTGVVPRGSGGLNLTTVPERVPSGLLPPGIPTPEGPGPFLP